MKTKHMLFANWRQQAKLPADIACELDKCLNVMRNKLPFSAISEMLRAFESFRVILNASVLNRRSLCPSEVEVLAYSHNKCAELASWMENPDGIADETAAGRVRGSFAELFNGLKKILGRSSDLEQLGTTVDRLANAIQKFSRNKPIEENAAISDGRNYVLYRGKYEQRRITAKVYKDNPESELAFRNEVQFLASHGDAPCVDFFGAKCIRPYTILFSNESVGCVSLRESLKSGKLSGYVLTCILYKIGKFLEYLHSNNYVYGNLTYVVLSVYSASYSFISDFKSFR